MAAVRWDVVLMIGAAFGIAEGLQVGPSLGVNASFGLNFFTLRLNLPVGT